MFRREFDCQLASSGRSALALLERDPFDCAFIDYRMPTMDGLQLAAVMAERWPTVVRMIVTGNAEVRARGGPGGAAARQAVDPRADPRGLPASRAATVAAAVGLRATRGGRRR